MGEATVIIGVHVCEVVREHGREWAVCPKCGAQWSLDGGDAEQVSEGDGFCEEEAREEEGG
jgi:hypothetical protein